jgi:hypothetical protein
MELDIVLGAQGWDDDGRSDGGSAWAPSDGSRSRAISTATPLICKGLAHTVISPGTYPITVTNPHITGCSGCPG